MNLSVKMMMMYILLVGLVVAVIVWAVSKGSSENFIQENCAPCAAAFAAYKNGELCNYLPYSLKVPSGNKDASGNNVMVTVYPSTDCKTINKAVDPKTMSIPDQKLDPVTKKMIPNWTPSVQASLINFSTYIDHQGDKASQIMNKVCHNSGLCSAFPADFGSK